MKRRSRTPVVLGCCPDEPRCALCPPPPPEPDPETVRALCTLYAASTPVAFFGGAPPSDAALDAIDRRPFVVRIRPDLLTRERAEALVARGALSIELDALTFDDAVLRAIGRRYRGALVRRIAEGLHAVGVRVGVVLAPGLPGTTFDGALSDAEAAAEIADFVRIHPALVLEGSGLERRYRAGTYEPLPLGEAVRWCRAMVEVLDGAGVDVVRIGMQPGPDGFGRAVAGPSHPSFRELVEARRVLDRLRGLLHGTPSGARIAIRCAPRDETRARGPLNQHIRTLRAELGAEDVRVVPDPELERGALEVDVSIREAG